VLRSSRPHAGDAVPDMTWAVPVGMRVLEEARLAAIPVCRALAPVLDRIHRDAVVVVDAERGSARFTLAGTVEFSLAVSDIESARQLAAASDLGGLVLRVSQPRPGVLHVFGQWERFRYSLLGLPSVRTSV